MGVTNAIHVILKLNVVVVGHQLFNGRFTHGIIDIANLQT